ADLEKEVKKAEGTELLTDTTGQLADSLEKAVTTPDVTPTEPAKKKEMPIRNNIVGFTVQVAASGNYENTGILVEKYKERGYEPFVTEADINGELFYRVRIGVFETFNEANQLGLELKDKYSINYWVDNN
ncbi:MAG: SPOR domain-containing protein, partial [Candidatus Zixiibacteriota bacterium]